MTKEQKTQELNRYKKELHTKKDLEDIRSYLIGIAWAIAGNSNYTAARKGLQLQLLYEAYEELLREV